MSRPADVLQAALKGAILIAVFAAVLVALLLAWWVAAMAVVGWIAYSGVRRLFAGKKSRETREDVPLIIEGESRGEAESLADSRRERQSK